MVFTSVIIPVYNDEQDLEQVLERLSDQTISTEHFEVIVIDNGSTDSSKEVAQKYPFVQLLEETKFLNSPYSCRNRGIEVSKGEIIALLDASCKPVSDWLEQALKCFNKKGSDLVGGEVLFDFKEKVTAAKIYDAINNIRMKDSIENRNIAKTANLFVKKTLFYKVGFFPEGIRSGGDVRWTRRATSKGFSLIFCEKAVVYKTARAFSELLKKQWRVGTYQPLIQAEKGIKTSFIKTLIRALLPVSVKKYRAKMANSPYKYENVNFTLFIITAQAVRFILRFANIWGLIRFQPNRYLK